MKEECVKETIAALKEAGVNFVSGVPDSWQRNLFEAIRDDKHFMFYPVGNEGVAFAMCAGAWLAGKKPCLLMENSGLRVAAEEIARLGVGDNIPVFMLMSYRGDVGEMDYFAISHGRVMEPLLNAFHIPYLVIRRTQDLRAGIVSCSRLAYASKFPAAACVGGDII